VIGLIKRSGNYQARPGSMYQEEITLQSLGKSLVGRLFWPATNGSYPGLIIAHGALMYKESYFELCEYLARQGQAAFALDMHGHGGSQGERFQVEMKEWIADIQAAVDFLAGLPRITKIGAWGHSSGGTAILETALIEPRLAALITLDATVLDSLPPHHSLLLRSVMWLARIKKALTNRDWRISLLPNFTKTPGASDPQVERKFRSDPRMVAAYASVPLAGSSDSFFVDTIRRVPAITAPTLVLWGEDDQLDPPESARQLYEALTCKKALHIIPGNGHMGHLDRNKAMVFDLTAQWALENLV
jgi:alpha-beta hydrolase superfamily lysophospholipase